MAEIVRIGDIITLQNIQVKNYLCAEGILSDDLIVGTMDSFDDNWFQICLPRQYTAAQELKEFMDLQKEDLACGIEIDAAGLRHLNALRTGARNEHKMNELYMKNKTGEIVHYGDSIQLLHVKSRKYITVMGHQVAEHERENIRVCLHPTGTPDSWLIIQPRFKINQSGDPVLSNAEIKLNIAERLNEYLHCTEKGYSHGYREVNASLEPTSWLLSIFQSSAAVEDPNIILASELISFFDPETQSMLSVFQRPAIINPISDDTSCVSDDDSIMDFSVDGEIVMEAYDGKQVQSSALWLLETKQRTSGGPIQWRTDHVRIKHVNTGMYMHMSRKARDTYTLSVTPNPNNRGTLFSLHELHSSNNYLMNKRPIQISHNSCYLERGELREISHFSHYLCTCSKNKSNALYLFISKETLTQSTTPTTSSSSSDTTHTQPLDVYVGSAVRNFFREYLTNIQNFSDYNPFPDNHTSNSHDSTTTVIDRLWPKLNYSDDKLFYYIIEKTIHYLKGHPISDTPILQQDNDTSTSTSTDDEDDNAVNEFGEMIRNDVLIGKRQKMFYEQHTLDIILILLNTILPLVKSNYIHDIDFNSLENEIAIPTTATAAAAAAIPTTKEAEYSQKYKNLLKMSLRVSKYLFRLLLQAIKRNQENQIYVSNHMHVILGWVGIQQVAANVVKEMLSGNMELQTQHIGVNEIKIFTNQLINKESHMNSMYFVMLRAFCSCNGSGINRNQGYVLDELLQISKDVFIKIRQSSNADPINTQSYFLPSIYIPENILEILSSSSSSSPSSSLMLGSQCLQDGLPYLSITWQSPDEKYLPEILYNKKVIPLADMFRGIKHYLRTQISGSVGGVLMPSSSSSNLNGNIPPPPPSSSSSTPPSSSIHKRKLRKKSLMTPILSKNKEDIHARDLTAERKETVVQYMIAQLYLLGELCLERNISAIIKIEKLIPYEYLIAILSEQTLTSTTKSSHISDLYGASAWLITTLYIDRESESTSCLPCHSKVWSELDTTTTSSGNGTTSGSSVTPKEFIVTVAKDRIYRYGLLQHIISSHIKSMKGISNKWEPYSLQMIMMMKKLVNLRYYGTLTKLQDIIDPLMIVLNRKNPDIDIIKKQKSINKSSTSSVKNIEDLGKFYKNKIWQKELLQFMESITELIIVMCIVFISTTVSIIQMIQGYHGIGYDLFDLIILLFFAFEVSIRGYLHHYVRKKWSTFFLDHFVQLDIGIVVLDIIVMASESALGTVGSFSGVLRTIRLLRLIRVIRAARLLKVVVPKDNGPIIKWALPARYRTASITELQTMVCMIDVLRDIQNILDERNLNLLLSGFKEWNMKYSSSSNTKDNTNTNIELINNIFSLVIQQSQQLTISSPDRDDILLDLLMYISSDLVQSVLELLMSYHTSYNKMIYNITNTQLLISNKREKQYYFIQQSLLQLDRYIENYPLWCNLSTNIDKEYGNECEQILIKLQELCCKKRLILEFNEEYEPDIEIQNLLRNLGCWNVCWKLLLKLTNYYQSDLVDTTSLSYKLNINILTQCNNLLYWYGYNNHKNQENLYEQLQYFMNTIDLNINSYLIIKIIFYNNENLMRKIPIHYIKEMTEKIYKNGKFPQYLSLLSSITVVGEKNILENQYEIIKQISSPNKQKKILTFCCSSTSNLIEYQRKLKLMSPYLHKKETIVISNLPVELQYHIELLKVLSGCTMGLYNITTIETKVQAMYNYYDVIDSMLDQKCLLIIKIYSGLFLYNSTLEVEMLIPGLVFSSKIWQLFESFLDILSSSKDILRQIERNGWDSMINSHSLVEYYLVISMIIYGFFKLYYDPISFRRDHLSTYGTQSSTLSLSMNQIDNLILKLFDNIRSIYELDSPLLSKKHKQLLYDTLYYLGRAKGMNVSEIIEMTHLHSNNNNQIPGSGMSTSGSSGSDGQSDQLENELSQKLSYFIECLHKNSYVNNILKDEFQSIITKISNLPRANDSTSTSTVRYEPLLKKLVDHVRGNIEIISHSSGREKYLNDRYTKTTIWIIQIFRTMIENVWGMTIYERDDDGGEEQDIASANIIQTFNTCGITTLCIDLIAIGINRELVLECIKLTVAMLFKEGGALQIQQTINKHLIETDSEFFFLLLRKIINDLIAWHDWKKITKTIKLQELKNKEKKISLINEDVGEKLNEQIYQKEAEEEGNEEDEEEIPADIIAIRFMQLMCEGHYGPNQDIMRIQENKTNSINLLDDYINYLVCISHIPCKTSTTAGLAIGATILEVIQGPCEGNQDHFALNTTLIETLNHLLRARIDKKGLNLIDELNLKKTAIDIFQALLEGQGKKVAVYERVLSVIHLDVIQLMCVISKSNQNNNEKKKENKNDNELDKMIKSNTLSDKKGMNYFSTTTSPTPGTGAGTSGDDENDENIYDEETLNNIEDIKISLRTESLVLLQMLCDFKPALRKELEVLNGGSSSSTTTSGGSGSSSGTSGGGNNSNGINDNNVAYIEIMWRGELQRRFFNIPSICQDFTDASKSNFVEYVDRSSHENKLLDMYKRAKVIYIELQHQQFIKEIGLNKIFSRTNQNRATWITFTLACAINIILLIYYEGEDCFKNYNELTNPEVYCDIPSLGTKPRAVINVLNYLQITFSSFTLIMFLIVRAPVQYISTYKQGKGVIRSILATALDPLTMYYFIYVILAIAAIRSDYILTFFLLDIVVKNSYAMDVMIAVFTPIKQLAVALCLSLIVMYIFAMFVFLWMNNPNALTTPSDCETLFSCWKFALSYGSSGDFGAAMLQKVDNQWLFYFLFDLAIRFVLLNVVRGITVDTFSELRLLKLERLKDTKETCFICGLDKQIFDRDKLSKGFPTHIKVEHNMWNYLYFMIYIWEQDKDDDDGLEQYVRRCIESIDISWIPAHKAMSLSIFNEEETMNNSSSGSSGKGHGGASGGGEHNKIKETFNKNLIELENNLLLNLNQYQTEITTTITNTTSSITTTPATAMKQNQEKEVTQVLSFNSLISFDDDNNNNNNNNMIIMKSNTNRSIKEEDYEEEGGVGEPQPQQPPHSSRGGGGGGGGVPSSLFKSSSSRYLTKSQTLSSIQFQFPNNNANDGSSIVIIEIIEILGLTFPSRILETISCVIRTKYGITSLGPTTRLITQEKENPIIVFDPNEVLVFQGLLPDAAATAPSSAVHDERIMIQIIRGNPPKYLAKVELSIQEIIRENEQRIQKFFYGEIYDMNSRGILVLNTKIISSDAVRSPSPLIIE